MKWWCTWLIAGCAGLDEGAGDLRTATEPGAAIDVTCGDGLLDIGEQCDDGNTADHDGCSAACTLELVAQFAFTGAAGSETTLAAELADLDLAATPVISRGAGIISSPASDAFSASGWTTAAAIDPTDYFSFTVAPAAGNTMNLIALQLDERRSATGIRSWSVRSSLDGFASDIAVFAVPDDVLFRTESIPLSPAFRGLATAVELRLYGFQGEADGGTWRIDNLLLIGEVGPTCGNGILDPGEQCDDGNTADHDGCAAVCTREVVAQFSFTGAAGTEATFAAELADPELTAAPVIRRGAGVAPSLATDAFSAAGWTTSAALDPGDFFAFTVAPDAGAVMNLFGLQLDERRSATGIRRWSVRSSLDGFTSDLAELTMPDDILFRTETIPLPAAFRGLTTAVELRLYGFQAEADGGTWRVDNLIVIGDVAVTCGNGTIDPGEQCDDGNTADGDACESDCSLPGCGNGIVDLGEQCDDGNTVGGDGCEASCTNTQILYIKSSNTGSNDVFGGHVALSADGSTLAVGADGEDSIASGVNGNQADNSTRNAGAVYIFTRNGTTWQQQAYIKASNPGIDDAFGFALSLSGDGSTLAVGAFEEDSSATGINGNQASDSATDSGAVYVFTRTGTTWSQQAYIKASNTGTGDEFGRAVALSGDGTTLAVAAPSEDSNATGINGNQTNDLAASSGAVYVFMRSGTTWSQQAYVKASNTASIDRFGADIAVSGDGATLVVGAEGESSAATGVDSDQNSNAAPSSGAAYVFTRGGTTWSQQAYLKASNTETGDDFGRRVALSRDGSTVAVTAPLEDSAATGANGNQADNSMSSAGAVYVFARSGSTWAQQAYLKGSNPGVDDELGFAISLSDDGSQLAVGAPLEDSAATGVNGDQTSNAGRDSGAAYRFVRSGATWSQSAYVKASNTGAGDSFGFWLSLSGDGSMLAVGAFDESSSATGINGNQTNDATFHAGAVYLYH